MIFILFFRGWFWGYEETRGMNVACLSVQGSASVIAPLLLNISARSDTIYYFLSQMFPYLLCVEKGKL